MADVLSASHQFGGHKGPVYALVPGAMRGTFISGSGDGTLVRWDLAAPDHGELLARTDQGVFCILPLQGTDLLVVGGANGDLRVIDLAQRIESQLLRFHTKGIFRIAALPQGRLACAGGDGVLSIWSVDGERSLRPLRSIPLSESKLRDLALAPNGDRLAVACGDGTVRILETQGFNETHTLVAHEGGANALAWHPGKPALLSGGKDGHLRIWHTGEEFKEQRSIAVHRSTVYRIVFDAEGSRCATTSRDKTAKLWAADSFEPMNRLDRDRGGHALSVNDALWLNGDLITAGDDRRIVRWASSL